MECRQNENLKDCPYTYPGITFREKVLRVVARIPKGKTMSYKKVARLAGSPRAYRAVGNILNKNYNPKVPCHRVIRSDGKIGGYNRGMEKKRALLNRETTQWSLTYIFWRK